MASADLSACGSADGPGMKRSADGRSCRTGPDRPAQARRNAIPASGHACTNVRPHSPRCTTPPVDRFLPPPWPRSAPPEGYQRDYHIVRRGMLGDIVIRNIETISHHHRGHQTGWCFDRLLLATRLTGISRRSEARNTISLITRGQASASIQIFTSRRPSRIWHTSGSAPRGR